MTFVCSTISVNGAFLNLPKVVIFRIEQKILFVIIIVVVIVVIVVVIFGAHDRFFVSKSSAGDSGFQKGLHRR